MRKLAKPIRNSRLNIACRIGKEMTRAKTQSTPSSEKQENILSLRSWRLGARKFLELVLSNISNESA
jgi:hypothetical protein